MISVIALKVDVNALVVQTVLFVGGNGMWVEKVMDF